MLAYAGPPALTWTTAFTRWTFSVVGVGLAVGLGVAYRAGLRRLRDTGAPWPNARTITYGMGLAALVLVTCSSLGAYARVVAAVFAAQLALMLTLVPVLLALGRPVELVQAGSGPAARRRLDRVLGSAPVRALTHPLVGLVLVTGFPFLVWFTGWYEAALRHAWVHGLTLLVTVMIGFAFFWPALESDDERRRVPWIAITVIVFAETVLDSLPGIVLWQRASLLAPDYWAALARPWGRTPLADQRLGGLVFWGVGELVGLPILLVTVAAWMRADGREAARIDAELDAAEAAEAAAQDDSHN